jgi:hypothetical protein
MSQISKEKKKVYNKAYREKTLSKKDHEEKLLQLKVKEEKLPVEEIEENEEIEEYLTEDDLEALIEERVNQRLKPKDVIKNKSDIGQDSFFLKIAKESMGNLLQSGTMMLVPLVLKMSISYLQPQKTLLNSKLQTIVPKQSPILQEGSSQNLPTSCVLTPQALPGYFGE